MMMNTKLLQGVVLLLVLMVSADIIAGETSEMVVFDHKCYWVDYDLVWYTNALGVCQRDSGIVTTFLDTNTEEAAEFVFAGFVQDNIQVWIGMVQYDFGSMWHWEGSSINQTDNPNWDLSDQKPEENCATAQKRGGANRIVYIPQTCHKERMRTMCRKDYASCPVTPRPIIFYREWYRGNVIFVDYPFQCSGAVAAVEFYAIRAGTFYFSAWRPSATGDSWTLLGYNAIVSEGEGAQTRAIPPGERIVVAASDVFGYFYDKGDNAIIPSKNIQRRFRNGTSSRFVSKRQTREDLSIGVTRSGLAGDGRTERIVSINPIFCS